MLEEMKREIEAGLETLKQQGELTGEKIRQTTRDITIRIIDKAKAGETQARILAKEAIAVSMTKLKEASKVGEEHVSAALDGVAEGLRRREHDAVERARYELWLAKARLREEEAALAQRMHDTLEGAKDSAKHLSGEAQQHLEMAIIDAKLKGAELLGVTRESVRHAMEQAAASGKDVEQTAKHIARDATAKALAQSRLGAERLRTVSHSIYAAALEVAEKAGGQTREIARGAMHGIYEGTGQAVERLRHLAGEAGEKSTAYLQADWAETREDLHYLEEHLAAALHKAAQESGEAARKAWDNLQEESHELATELRKKTHEGTEHAVAQLKKLGKESADLGQRMAHTTSDELAELGGRALALAKKVLSGVEKGAKGVFKH